MTTVPNRSPLNKISVQLAIEDFTSDTEVVSLGPGMQVTVYCRTKRPSGEQGHFLMELEERLRQALEEPVELYLQPRADDSALRQRKEKIQDWIDRKGMLKLQLETHHEAP